MLLVNHPLDCPICDQAGECYLQDYAFEYGSRAARTQEPRRKLLKRVDVGPRVVLDQERCILCRRCVRFCKEITKTAELGVFNLGDRSVLDTFPGEPLANDYSICTADICPVGALLSKDFHHKMRVWFLDETESVCPGCANGCNIKIGSARRQVHRFLPRRNDQVNDTWMCDHGPTRLPVRQRATAEGADHPARRRAGRRCRGTKRSTRARVVSGPWRAPMASDALAAIVSPHLTNEELFVLGRLISAGLRTAHHDVAVILGGFGRSPDQGREGGQRARRARSRARGGSGGQNLATIRAGIEAGTIRGLFVTGTDLWELWGDAAGELCARLETLVVQTPNEHPLVAHADVVLPGLTFAEKDGTFTNFAGRVQRIWRALDPGEQPTDGEIFLRLGRRLGMEMPPGLFDPAAVFGRNHAGVGRLPESLVARARESRSSDGGRLRWPPPSSRSRARRARGRWIRSDRSRSCAACW